jgi:hypothetical protein
MAFKRAIKARFPQFPFHTGWKLFRLSLYYLDEEYLLEVTSIGMTMTFDHRMTKAIIWSCASDEESEKNKVTEEQLGQVLNPSAVPHACCSDSGTHGGSWVGCPVTCSWIV